MSEHSDPVSDLRKRKQSVGTVKIKDDAGNTRVVELNEMTAADRELAEKFGYNPVSNDDEHSRTGLISGQVFKREFGYLATFSFAVSISGLFATVTTTYVYRKSFETCL